MNEERIPTLREAILRDSGLIALNALAFLVLALRVAGYAAGPQSSGGSANLVDTLLNHAGLTWFVLEIISMMTNEKRRALHDYIAGTVVVRVTKAGPAPS